MKYPYTNLQFLSNGQNIPSTHGLIEQQVRFQMSTIPLTGTIRQINENLFVFDFGDNSLTSDQIIILNNIVTNYIEIVYDSVSTVTLYEQQLTGINGGSSLSNIWQTRTLNTSSNIVLWCTLNVTTSIFTLWNIGWYRFIIQVPGANVGSHQTRLFNMTTNQEVHNARMGGVANSNAVNASNTNSTAVLDFQINVQVNTSPTNFCIQHRCQNAVESIGFGMAAGFTDGPEIYSRVTISQGTT